MSGHREVIDEQGENHCRHPLCVWPLIARINCFQIRDDFEGTT